MQLQYKNSRLLEVYLSNTIIDANATPTFTFETTFHINDLAKQIETIIKVNVLLENEEIARIQTNNLFAIANLDEILTHFSGSVPNNLLVICLSLSFSTTRGMFMQIAANSALRDIVFPIINPDELVSKMVLTPSY